MADHIWMTSPMLKAMTHPLRRRIISTMRPDTPMRAADLAKRLSEPANSVSFHLRKLAEAGMIIEAPEHARDKRDRVWVAAGVGYGVPQPGTLRSENEELLLRAYLDQAGVDLQDLVRRALEWAVEWSSGRDDVRRAELNIGTITLSREEALEMAEELNAVIARARRRLREMEPREGQQRQDWEFMTVVSEADLSRKPAAGPPTT